MRPHKGRLMSVERDPWSDYECRARPPDVIECADPRKLGERYVYLLGIYLGDGTISSMPKNVMRLRIFQDARYPLIVKEIAGAIELMTGRHAGRLDRSTWFEIYCDWKHWACAFPQHGVGRKHRRSIVLADWQQQIVERYPMSMLRGLIHSDGCRSINRIRRPTRDGVREYRYPRYFFTNASADIRAIFVAACDLAGVESRRMTEWDISVARRESVALMDVGIGPKA
jgi:hypothetical protein